MHSHHHNFLIGQTFLNIPLLSNADLECSIFLFISDGDVLYANSGDNVTLHCFCDSTAKHLSWYKQIPGEPPQIMSSFYKHQVDSNVFHKQFKDSKRLSVYTEEGLYNLKIFNVQESDSALYYCSYTTISVTEFDNGTFLLLKSRTNYLKSTCTYFPLL